MYEVEQKYRLGDPEAFLAKISENNVKWELEIHETDMYFQHPVRDFAQTDEALRLRQRKIFSCKTLQEKENSPEEEYFVTYKGPKLKGKTKTRQEIELPLFKAHEIPDFSDISKKMVKMEKENFSRWCEFFEVLGFRAVSKVIKIRKKAWIIWRAARVEISYDTLSELGCWAELELMARTAEEIPDAEMIIQSLAQCLGLKEVERKSYLELVMENAQKNGEGVKTFQKRQI
ncbi:MAG: class IV adenylate cyclase [Planctomycetia bacterium]|nr:class IV adenylate cyclase [Planctomycetia bacterium]